jgi:ribonuclease Z
MSSLNNVQKIFSMIEVIFIGVGSAIPMKDGTNSSYLVRMGGELLLIDCGPAILQQLDAVGVSPKEITHIFFTHRHGDHALGFPMLMLWYAIHPSASVQIPVLIGSELTLDTLDQMMMMSYGPELSGVLDAAPRMIVPQDRAGETRIHPHIKLLTFPMKHSEYAPVLGVRIETRGERLGERIVAFTGDTGGNDNIRLLGQNADLLVHESGLSATIEPKFSDGDFGHSTAQSAGKNAKAANAKSLALVHIDQAYEGRVHSLIEEAQSEFDGKVSAPTSGVVFQV